MLGLWLGIDDGFGGGGSIIELPGDPEFVGVGGLVVDEFKEGRGIWEGIEIDVEGGSVGESGFYHQSDLIGVDDPAGEGFECVFC